MTILCLFEVKGNCLTHNVIAASRVVKLPHGIWYDKITWADIY